MKLTKQTRYKLAQFLEKRLEENEERFPSSQWLLYLITEFTSQHYREKAQNIQNKSI